ncbi:hypothetical protein GCM10010247_22280 [Streptomyces calvus]|nr:hypothetical protein GCM10010247_22280 [Streptomyces calvus]
MVAESFEQVVVYPQAEHVGPHAYERCRTPRFGAVRFLTGSLIRVIRCGSGGTHDAGWTPPVFLSESNELR